MNAPVGRDRELRLLRDALARAQQGQGSLVLISGEAGIGKTTLVQVIAAEAKTAGFMVLIGQAFDLSATPPYGPWLELTDRFPDDPDLPPLPEVLKRGTGIGDLTNQLALFEVARDFFTELASSSPLLVILEDLHWADRGSLDLLRFLSRYIESQHLLIVATLRLDEFVGNDNPSDLLSALVRERDPERIRLLPLRESEIRALVDTHFRLNHSDEYRLTHFLIEHGEGNPLYTHELLRTLEEQEFLEFQSDHWVLRPLRRVPVPALLRQVIERRLSNLDRKTRKFLQAGAVIGAEINYDLWRELCESNDQELSEALMQAFDARLLEQNASGNGVQFTHALIRDAVLEGVVILQRQTLHRRIADILLNRPNQNTELIANHLRLANDPRAIEWLIKAGDRAAHAFAPLEAVDRYEAALDILQKRDSNPTLQGWLLVKIGLHSRSLDAASALMKIKEAAEIARQTNDHILASYALFHVGQVLFFLGEGGLPEVNQGIRQLRSLTQSEIDVLEVHSQGFDLNLLDTSHAIMLSLSGYFQQAIEIANVTLSRSKSLNDLHRNERGHGWVAIAHGNCFLGNPEMALVAFEKMHEEYTFARNHLYRALNSTFEYQNVLMTYFPEDLDRREQKSYEIEELWGKISGFSAPVAPRFGLLPVMLVEGSWTEALSLGLQHTNVDAIFRYVPLHVVGTIARYQGDFDLSWAQVKAGLPHGCDTVPGTSWYVYSLQLQQLAVGLSVDQLALERAVAWLSAHQRWIDWSGTVLMRSDASLLEARIHRTRNQLDAAHDAANHALSLAISPRQPVALLAAHRFLAELDTQSGNYASAEANLQRSLDLAEACAVPFERALTLLAIAALEIERGNITTARKRLASVRRICECLGARPTLDRVTMLEKRIGRPRTTTPSNLTARELEVLRLLACGLSDREIAERLFISHHTVMRHVSHILEKLGAESRTAAVAHAIRGGVVQ
jgi:DNA-binding CsgD family transcriptional regulator